MPPPRMIPIAKIRIDGDTQPRSAIDEALVADYCTALEFGEEFPAVSVLFDGLVYWLADGFHRYHAYLNHGRTDIPAIVESGDCHAARWAASGANRTHGKRRSHEDKRRAIDMALAERPQFSDRAIAEHVGVSHETVADRRAKMQLEKSPPAKNVGQAEAPSVGEKRTGLDGKQYPTESRTRNEKAKAMKDALGIDIPKALETLWLRREEVQAVLTAISRIKTTLNDAEDEKDKLWHGCNYSHAKAFLERAYAEIAGAKPWAVCPMCQGTGCRLCGSRGLISEHFYKNTVPENIRKANERQASG
jgi:hypothetical protein